MKIHTEIKSAQKLRQRAEAKYQVDMAMTSQPLPATETERYLHELQVHQIELEMQNEQLFHTQSELERKILELEYTIKTLNERNEQIRRLDQQQLLIFEASPLGITLVVDRTAIMVNRSFCAMTGYDKNDLIGKSTRINYRSQEDFEQFGAMAYPLLAAGKIVHGASVFRRKNGTCMDVSITGGLCDVNDSAGGTIWMMEDITRNKKEAAVLEARLRLMQRADHNTLQELLRATLDEVESLTGSQIGFFHFVEPDQITLSMQAWSTNTSQGMCQTVPTESHYPVSKAGVWSECVTTRQPAIHNDYVSLPHRKGLPDGHVPIIRELVVPILRGNKIVALLGVGNKESEYDQLDVDTASRLADLAWDIAEKKRTDDERTEIHNALQIKEERLENVIRGTDAGTWEWNILTGEVVFNERIAEMIGYTLEELSPLTIDAWHNAAHPVDLEIGRKLLHSHFKDPSSPYGPEMRMKHKNGHWIWVRNRGSVTSWTEEGRASIMHGTFIDITARKQSEIEMHKLARAVEQSPISIAITDSLGAIEFVNPKFSEITGYSLEEAFGQNPRVLKSGLTPPETHQKLWSAITAGNTWEGEFVNKRKDGSLFHEYAIISALRDGEGNITHYLAVKEDITEKKNIMEQLLHSQKVESIGQLAGGLAHDLNNILSVIKGYGTLLRVKGDLNQKESHYVDAIMEAVNDAGSLSQSMLAYSRKQVMKLAVSDLNVLLVKIGKFAERLLPENIELILTPADDPLLVNIDAGQIEQVMINITTNARDAMPGGGTLNITAGVENRDPATLSDKETSNIHHRYAVITARDTGHGMDEETKSRIFDPFFTTKEVGKGSGLGLSMTFGIVKQHGGEITVQSSPGNGTIFKIWLPLVDADAPEVINLSKPVDIIINDPGKRTGRILIAEDNQIFRLVLEEFFTEAGYDVILAEDGNKAVEMFKADRDGIDLVITDVLMPNKSGREARDEIKKLSETVKFIFMSGHTRDVLSHQGDLGDAELFMKPIDLPLLLSKVRELI